MVVRVQGLRFRVEPPFPVTVTTMDNGGYIRLSYSDYTSVTGCGVHQRLEMNA